MILCIINTTSFISIFGPERYPLTNSFGDSGTRLVSFWRV